MGRGHAAAAISKISPPAGLRLAIEMTSPEQEHLQRYALENREGDETVQVVTAGSHAGKTAAICGAGPSLKDAKIGDEVDEVFACNSALTWLASQGRKVTAGVSIDQTEVMLRDWKDAPDVPLYVASTCHPKLITYLRGLGRQLVFFHNYVGWADGKVEPKDVYQTEFDYYCRDWPPTIVCGEGATVVSRMIGVCQYMGFERIDIYGADCWFGPGDVAHANGEVATEAYNNPLIMSGMEYGRPVRTRPDMLMDAVHLAKRTKQSQGRIRLMGDTLPVALLGKPDEYLDQVCRRLAPGERHPDIKVI